MKEGVHSFIWQTFLRIICSNSCSVTQQLPADFVLNLTTVQLPRLGRDDSNSTFLKGLRPVPCTQQVFSIILFSVVKLSQSYTFNSISHLIRALEILQELSGKWHETLYWHEADGRPAIEDTSVSRLQALLQDNWVSLQIGLERMYGNSVFSFPSVWALSKAEGDWIFILVFIFECEHFLLLTGGKAVKWASVCSAGHRILYSVLGGKQDTFCLCWLPSLPHLLGARRAALRVDCTSDLSEFYWWGRFWTVFRPAKSGSLALLVRSRVLPTCALLKSLTAGTLCPACSASVWSWGWRVCERALDPGIFLFAPLSWSCSHTALQSLLLGFSWIINYVLSHVPKGMVYKWFVLFINLLRIWRNFALGPEKWNTCIFYCIRWHIGGSDAV